MRDNEMISPSVIRWCVALGWMFACCFLLVANRWLLKQRSPKQTGSVCDDYHGEFDLAKSSKIQPHPSESSALPINRSTRRSWYDWNEMTSPSATSNRKKSYTRFRFRAVRGAIRYWRIGCRSETGRRSPIATRCWRSGSHRFHSCRPDHGPSLYEIDDPSFGGVGG